MTTTAADTFARFVDVLAETLDDHDTDGDALAGAAAPVPLPLRPAGLRRGRRAAGRAAPPGPARARRLPADHHRPRRAPHRDRGRLRQQRGVHPRLHAERSAARRPAGGPGRRRYQLDAPSQVHFDPAGKPARPGPQGGHRHGSADPHGRAPRLACRSTRRRVRAGSHPSSWTPPSRSRSTASTRPHGPVAACPTGRADGDVGRRHPDRPYDIDAERAETLADIRAKLAEVGPVVPAQGARDRRRRPARRDLRRRDLRRRRGSSRTAG